MFFTLLGALAIGLSLGLLGSGGSILTVPVLLYLVGQPEKLAIGGSLLVVGLIASSAAVPYALHRQVDWRNVAWFGLPGMLGAWLGATLAHWVPGAVQLALFAVVMLVAAWRMLRGAAMQRIEHEPRRMAVVAGGFAVGALSGLVGVGGGFLIVPALVLLAGVPMIERGRHEPRRHRAELLHGVRQVPRRAGAPLARARLGRTAHRRRSRDRGQHRRSPARPAAAPGDAAQGRSARSWS